MLMVALIALSLNSLWSHNGILGASSDFSGNSLLYYTNNARLGGKERPLTIDSKLSKAAQAKANDLVAKNYWAHTAPDGRAPWSFIVASGYSYQQAGENLAYGFNSAGDVVTGWMNSAAHRANILNPNYVAVGFGTASAPNYLGRGPATVVVAEYAEPSGSVLPASVNNPSGLRSTTISRIQLLTGGAASWSLLAVAAVISSTLTVIAIRYAVKIRKALVKGERFVVKHPAFDTAMILVVVVGVVLSRASGFIR